MAAAPADAALINGHGQSAGVPSSLPGRPGRRGSDQWTPHHAIAGRGQRGAAPADAALINGHFPLRLGWPRWFRAAPADAALINGHICSSLSW